MRREAIGGGFLRRLVLLGLALLVGCAPAVMPPGRDAGSPRLEDGRLITGDGLALPLRRWLPEGEPKAVILALHGFNDHSNAFATPGAWFAAAGIATYAYDQRGFGAGPYAGLWPGRAALVDDLRAAVRLLRRRYGGTPLYLLGESMGGAVAMVALTGSELPAVDGVVLAAPAVWGRSTMPFYQRWALWAAERLIPWASFSGGDLGIQASDNIEMLRALGRDPLVIKQTRVSALAGLTDLMSAALEAAPRFDAPALILYGENDEVVPREPVFQMWRALPERAAGRQRLALYDSGWHMLLRDLEAAVVLADIAAWIDDSDAPLESGADRRAAAALFEGVAEARPQRVVQSEATATESR